MRKKRAFIKKNPGSPITVSGGDSLKIKTVIFDLGNVLLNYDAEKAAKQFAASCGVPVKKVWEHFFTSSVEKA